MVIFEIGRQDPPQVPFVQDDDVVQALASASALRAAAQPMTRSTYGFCQGDLGAVSTSSMLMALTVVRNATP